MFFFVIIVTFYFNNFLFFQSMIFLSIYFNHGVMKKEQGTRRPLYHYAGSLYSKKGFITRRKEERIIQSDEVISAQDLLITMMAFHGFTLLIHVIFFLLKDLENERLICICLCCQLPSWQHAVVVGVFNTIFGTIRKKIQDQPEL